MHSAVTKWPKAISILSKLANTPELRAGKAKPSKNLWLINRFWQWSRHLAMALSRANSGCDCGLIQPFEFAVCKQTKNKLFAAQLKT